MNTLAKEKGEDSFDLLCRFKNGSQKDRIEVPREQAKSFGQSLINIYRLNCFKSAPDTIKKKKIAKPSQKNPKSKTTLKQKERVKFFKGKKEEAKKRKEEIKKRKEFLYKLAKGIKA